jgi:D-aspartate ligase
MVLIPCTDAWAASVGRLEEKLAARFPASIPPRESLDICLDKGRFADMMVHLALPHPRTISIGAFDDVRTLWDSGFCNPFLKPRNSLAFSARFQRKAPLVENANEAAKWIREAGHQGLEFVLQEYIPGPATSHYYVDGFIDYVGTVCARFARRCVRLSDERFGVSSCMVSIPLSEAKAPIEILDQLLPALRYRGMFNAQFKYDERDGLFKLLDLNARAWGGVSLAVSCGVNVIDMAYQDALGRPVGRITSYPLGRYWVNAAFDNIMCWRLFREGRLTVRAWLRTRIGAVPAIFRWDDLLPAIVYFVQVTWREIRKRVKGTS